MSKAPVLPLCALWGLILRSGWAAMAGASCILHSLFRVFPWLFQSPAAAMPRHVPGRLVHWPGSRTRTCQALADTSGARLARTLENTGGSRPAARLDQVVCFQMFVRVQRLPCREQGEDAGQRALSWGCPVGVWARMGGKKIPAVGVQRCSVVRVSQPPAPAETSPECDEEACAPGARGAGSLCVLMLGFHIKSCLRDKFSPNIASPVGLWRKCRTI